MINLQDGFKTTMTAALFCATVLLLLSACQQTFVPGETVVLEQQRDLTLKSDSAQGGLFENAFELTGAPGQVWRLRVANNGREAVTIAVSGAQPTELQAAPQAWLDVRIQLQAERLELTWSGGPLHIAHPYREPVAKSAAKRPANMLLVSIDTLRFDAFTPQYMPQLHELFSREGVILNRAYTPAPWTLPAHASLLTGLYPYEHGVRLPNQKLAAKTVTLAERLAEAGYYNLAVTEGNYMSATFGLHQGFHRYEEHPPNMMSQEEDKASKLAGNIIRLERLIEEAGGGQSMPLFAFFHTYEVHCPYFPRGELSDPHGRGQTAWLLENEGKIEDQTIFSSLKELYMGEVLYTDRLLAPLLTRLLEQGWMIALISDHGEEFGEHGGLLHADTLYEEVMHVPLAFAGFGAGGVIEAPVSLVDLPPTIMAALNLPLPTGWERRNMLRANPGPIFGETFFLGPHIEAQDPRLGAVWQGYDKLIQSRNFERYQAELYLLGQDPGEQVNRQQQDPQRRDALYLFLDAYFRKGAAQAEQIGELSPEQLELMRTLGYVK